MYGGMVNITTRNSPWQHKKFDIKKGPKESYIKEENVWGKEKKSVRE